MLASCSLDPQRYKSHRKDSIETCLRTRGLGVIHSGENALRHTPHVAVLVGGNDADHELDRVTVHVRTNAATSRANAGLAER